MKREKQRRSLSKNGDKRLEKDNFELEEIFFRRNLQEYILTIFQYIYIIFEKLYSIYFLNFKKGLIQFLKLVIY